jgi:hypothetical protein
LLISRKARSLKRIIDGNMARVEDFSLSHHPFRRFIAPSTGRTLLTTLVVMLLQRARKPSFQRMSHEWLLSNEREFRRHEH